MGKFIVLFNILFSFTSFGQTPSSKIYVKLNSKELKVGRNDFLKISTYRYPIKQGNIIIHKRDKKNIVCKLRYLQNRIIKETHYDLNGQKELEINYFNDSCFNVLYYYTNGEVLKEFNVKNWELDGRYISYYPSGIVQEISNYLNGKLTSSKEFWDNSNLKKEFFFYQEIGLITFFEKGGDLKLLVYLINEDIQFANIYCGGFICIKMKGEFEKKYFDIYNYPTLVNGEVFFYNEKGEIINAN